MKFVYRDIKGDVSFIQTKETGQVAFRGKQQREEIFFGIFSFCSTISYSLRLKQLRNFLASSSDTFFFFSPSYFPILNII